MGNYWGILERQLSEAFMLSDLGNNWAQAYITRLHQAKIISGYPDGSFRPDASVSRAEFATLVVGAFPDAPLIRPRSRSRMFPVVIGPVGIFAMPPKKGFLRATPTALSGRINRFLGCRPLSFWRPI
ncbi:MAG: S-layer homology domain-containing protein [Oscillatoriales cyanobacterium SM2_3_0]|nr:S-layer homology domain-containing protein [Oscillatoriales cyanobacterium SM2_3_0]